MKKQQQDAINSQAAAPRVTGAIFDALVASFGPLLVAEDHPWHYTLPVFWAKSRRNGKLAARYAYAVSVGAPEEIEELPYVSAPEDFVVPESDLRPQLQPRDG